MTPHRPLEEEGKGSSGGSTTILFAKICCHISKLEIDVGKYWRRWKENELFHYSVILVLLK